LEYQTYWYLRDIKAVNSMSNLPRIFIAYSRQDKAQLEQIRTHLRVLERGGHCHIFYDGVIEVGERWNPRIKAELHQADIFLLLVSAEFLDSDFVNEIELPIILQREQDGSARVMPVILRECLWQYSALEPFQAILHEGQPIQERQAYGQVAKQVAAEVERRKKKPTNPIPAEAPRITVPQVSPSGIDLAKVDPFHGEMVLIKGGSFEMGDVFNEGLASEKPVHTVQVPDFYLARKPVSQAQWEKIMGYNPSHFKGDPQLPVEKVNWEEAQEFIRILNKRTELKYRLPSEAEWEYAAREGGDKIRFGNGKNIAVPTEINFDSQAKENTQAYLIKGENRQKTTPVGSFPANALGLQDMSGNVWEWCTDVWHDNYQNAPLDGSAWVEGGEQDKRVVRGGSWLINAADCRASCRLWFHFDNRLNVVGFRLARS
jgi:formylglycine-generating enzyme required for sulfatase activity